MNRYILIAIIVLSSFLRLYKLDQVPPSLYWDEASLGYNAYSILKTAKDEHGRFLPITNFAAFGDYKPPGYIYATVPSIALFGLNEFAIRFPSALFGIFTVITTYFLAKKLFENKKIALISAFFLGISPWHIQFSRGAFEANLGLFFSVLGIYAFIKFKEKPIWLILSVISFIFAMNTFTGQRLFVPFILIILAIHFFKDILKNIKIVMLSGSLFLILFLPLLLFVSNTIEGKLRFNEVTIFKDLSPINESIHYREADNFSFFANIAHNRRIFFTNLYLIHYFDAFNPSFLFFDGDDNPRLSIQEFGELYHFDLILILGGLFFLFYKKQKYRFLIVGWLLISPLGPATARETPHALRMIHILPTFQLISAYGLYQLFKYIKYKKIFVFFSVFIITISVFYYLHMYYIHWPKNYSGEWQYGYKQAVAIAQEKYSEVDKIIVTKSLGRPYIYFLLYMKFDPNKYLQSANIVKDDFFFIDVNSFDKFIFSNNPNEEKVLGNLLYIVPSGQLPANSYKIKTIEGSDRKAVFDIGQLKR